MKKIFFFLLLCIGTLGLFAQTPINSDITTNTTWDISGSPYQITEIITINSGITLNIDPGVRVEMIGFSGIKVDGKLIANGTKTDSIYFIGKPSSFGTISADIAYIGEIEMSYARLDSMDDGIRFHSSFSQNPQNLGRLNIQHTVFSNLDGVGISAGMHDSSRTVIDSCLFYGNLYGIAGRDAIVTNSIIRDNWQGVIGSQHQIENCQFARNTNHGIKVSLPITLRGNSLTEHKIPLMLVLARYARTNRITLIENNTLIDNKLGLYIFRDTGLVTSQDLVIRQNQICTDSLNVLYEIGFSGPSTYPLVELKQNCWCEWSEPAVWANITRPPNQPLNIAPIDSTCLPRLVFPGDANHDQVVNNTDLLPIGLHYGQTGPSRPLASLNWIGQRCDDWSSVQSNGINVKHADTDGNGTIDSADTLAIGQNYGLTHSSWRRAPNQNGVPLRFQMPTTNLTPGDTLSIPIQLGTVDTPATKIYGIAFSINYNNTLLDSAGVKLSYAGSWLGTKNTNMITFDKDFFPLGQTDIALVRTDQNPQNGNGLLANIVIVISEDIAKKERPLELSFTNVVAINELGEAIEINEEDGISTIEIGTNIEDKVQSDLKIYPNPAKEMLHLESPGIDINAIRIYALDGKLMAVKTTPFLEKYQLDTSGFKSGLYVIRVDQGSRSSTHKIMIQH